MPTARNMIANNIGIAALVMLGAVALVAVVFRSNPYSILLVLLILIPAGYISFRALSDALKIVRCEDELVLKDEGIQLHWRQLSKAASKDHNFIPFEEIAAAFPNLNKGLPYLTLLLRSGEKLEIDKAYIVDLVGFISQLSEKVTIETADDMLLNTQERWYVRCCSEK